MEQASQHECKTLWVESTMQDIRLALRALRNSPAFAATAILILALGIGANTAIFQLLDAVRLRSLPIAEPGNLAVIQINGGRQGFGIGMGDEFSLTYPLWEQIRKNQQAFSTVFAWAPSSLRFGQGSQEREAKSLYVSGEMFAALGTLPARGRLFSEQDDRPGCGTPGVVLSYPFWQREFGGESSAIGSQMTIEGHPVEIVGVTPPSFFGLEVGKNFDFAVPFCSDIGFHPEDAALSRRDYFWLTVMGRLKPDWTLARAAAQLQSISPGIIEATMPDRYSAQTLEVYRNFRLVAFPAGNGVSSVRKAYDASLWLLLVITGLVLLIACANLANLILARASTRDREMAVRLALGATRWLLVRQLLSEGALLVVFGGILGAALAALFSRALVALLSKEGDLLHLDLSADWRVLTFTAAIALSTCVIFSLAPAFRSSRVEPIDALKTGGRGMTAGRGRFSFQRSLVVSQIAVSLVLLVGALLFVRSFWKLMTVDPGFRQEGVVLAFASFDKLNLSTDRYELFEKNLLEQVRGIPIVQSAAAATRVPFFGSWTSGVTVNGIEGSSKFTWASPDYFQTLQIPFIAGRDLNERDTSSSSGVAVVSESFVKKFLSGTDPIGKLIRTAPEPYYPAATYQIVGVVRDTKYAGLREEVPPPEAFAPLTQLPFQRPWMSIVVRSGSPPSAVIPALRGKLGEFNPSIVTDFEVLRKDIENGLLRERMMALLSGFFGALAALLAVVGLYGVISYIVATRRNEIGIRMALGASRQNMVGEIIRQTLTLLALGVGAGVILSLAATRGAGALLFGLRPNDPLSLAGAGFLLIVVALVASYVPARRASRIDPMIALRYE